MAYPNLQKLAESLPYRERVEAFGLNPEGKLLSGLYDNDRNTGVFGGGIDPGETPEQAAVREFLEEAGYRLHNPRLLDVPPAINEWDPNKVKKDERQRQFRGSKTYFVTGDVGDAVSDEERGSDMGSGLLDIKFRSLQNALRNIKVNRSQSAEVAKRRRAVLRLLLEELRKGA